MAINSSPSIPRNSIPLEAVLGGVAAVAVGAILGSVMAQISANVWFVIGAAILGVIIWESRKAVTLVRVRRLRLSLRLASIMLAAAVGVQVPEMVQDWRHGGAVLLLLVEVALVSIVDRAVAQVAAD